MTKRLTKEQRRIANNIASAWRDCKIAAQITDDGRLQLAVEPATKRKPQPVGESVPTKQPALFDGLNWQAGQRDLFEGGAT